MQTFIGLLFMGIGALIFFARGRRLSEEAPWDAPLNMSDERRRMLIEADREQRNRLGSE